MQALTPKELAVVVVDMLVAPTDACVATVVAAGIPREALGLFGCALSEDGICDKAGVKGAAAAARTALCGMFATADLDAVVVASGAFVLIILLVFQSSR